MSKKPGESEKLPEVPPEPPPEKTEPAQVIVEGGWGPAGSDIAGPPAPTDNQASRIGSFPTDADDDAEKQVRRKPADD